MSTRYLFYASYIGTRFSGSQYQRHAIGAQNVLNNAIALALNVPHSLVSTTSASRTDTGVHALRTAYTFDFPSAITHFNTTFDLRLSDDKSGSDYPYPAEHFAAALNHIIKEMNFEFRIVGCRKVANGFCPRRHARSRTYLYKLAVLKPQFDNDPNRPVLYKQADSLAPAIEKDRCWHVNSNFHPELFSKGASMFEGVHDFRCFTGQVKCRPGEEEPSTTKIIRKIEVLNGEPLLNPIYEPLSGCFDYYDVLFHAKSFAYRQIRKMMGFLVNLAQEKVTCDNLQLLLDHPSDFNAGKFKTDLAPAGGLYLLNIAYDESDFDNPRPSYSAKRTETLKYPDEGEETEEIDKNDELKDYDDCEDVVTLEKQIIN